MARRLARTLVAAVALVTAGLGTAHANGRFPRTVKLIARPGHPQEMVLGVTFGLLTTTDDGAHWRWACESAVGFTGTYDPDYELSPTGALFATTFSGMRMTRDGCHWSAMPEPLGERYVSAIAVGPDGAIYAGLADPADSRIFKSTDDGRTFVPTGALGMLGDWWMSIDVAPGRAQRVYATGFRAAGGGPRQRIMFRSDDGGASWTELPTTALVGTDSSDLQIAAISPIDPDRVLVRMTLTGPALQETIYLSENAGAAPGQVQWAKVLEVPDNIPGVVVRRDGTVLAATPFEGLRKSTDGGRTFTTEAGVGYEGRCLFEREDGVLFLCANDLPPDERALTSSTTGAAGSWIPRLRFAAIAGPIDCPTGTLQKDECEGLLWCGLVTQLGITNDPIDCPSLVDAGIDAGTAPPPDKGCCSTGAPPPVMPLAVAALGLLVPRRRRPRA